MTEVFSRHNNSNDVCLLICLQAEEEQLKKRSRFSYLQEINDDLLMQKKNACLLSLHVTFEYPMREKFDSVQIG